MSGDQNWRTDVDAGDYFLHQKKQLALADRRPVLRRASDLVGPGIGASAVRITDYNNLLATFNGYYSSAPGAAFAPNAAEPFVGQVISDAELGGRQVFTGLTSGTEYVRTFLRSPTDPESIGWGAWSGSRIPAIATSQPALILTPTLSGSNTVIAPSALALSGEAGVFERSDAGVRIRKQGVYTGSVQVGATVATSGTVYFRLPDWVSTTSKDHPNANIGPTFYIPFTVIAADDQQGFSVTFLHDAGAGISRDVWWKFSCTRIGDAV